MSEMGSTVLDNGINTKWIGTVNFNLRKPNFIIIHHTAQDLCSKLLKTFTVTRTQVSSHYNCRWRERNDDKEWLRFGMPEGSWGKDTDINSSSIGDRTWQ
jgi:N-acetylmuramoyl-L-alanine amidase